jgi:hypothetical protein
LWTLFAVVTVAATFAGWIAYKNRPGYPIEFVVPLGFHGTIHVIKDREKGQGLNLDQGRNVLNVPSDGTILVNNTRPFHQWHTEKCRDADGHIRQLDSGGVMSGESQIGMSRSGSTDDDGTTHIWEVR